MSSVKQGAECNTEHNLLRTRIRISRLYQPKCKRAGEKRFDVAKLLGSCEDENGGCTVQGHFQELVSDTVKKTWKADSALEEK